MSLVFENEPNTLALAHSTYALFRVIVLSIRAKHCVQISIEDTIEKACSKMDLYFFPFHLGRVRAFLFLSVSLFPKIAVGRSTK